MKVALNTITLIVLQEIFTVIVFHDFRAKIKNIEATEEAKQKLVQERMRKRDHEVSAFVPTNMAANYIQHNRCMYDFYKGGSGVGLGHCSIQYSCQLYTTQQMYV